MLDQLDTAWHVHSVPISGASSQQGAAEITRHPSGNSNPSDPEGVAAPLAQPGGVHGTLRSTAAALVPGTGIMLGLTTMAAVVIMMSFWVLSKPQGSHELLSSLSLQVRWFLFTT